MMMGYWGMGWLGLLIHVFLIVGVIYFIVSLVKRDGVSDRNCQYAEAILKERFARGEITQEEYERMREVLKK